MTNVVLENIQSFGPVFAGVWIITILCVLLWPQRYRNSFLLMAALLVTMLFISGFFDRETSARFLLVCFLLVMLALFLVPLLLILNGVQMIRRESFSPAHVLSLALGIVVGIGEIAAVIYVLRVYDFQQAGKANLWILLLVLTVFYFSFLVLSFVMYSIFIQIIPHRMRFDYVIIHGCGLKDGDQMTRLLSDRVDKALELYRRCKVKPIIIPSGGRGVDESISEAQAMKNYLLDHGIPEEKILLEDASATTRENLLNSKALIDAGEGGKRTALVSSNYHIYRCLRLARQVGLKCTGIGARVAPYYWPSALIREFIAIFLTRSFLIWSILAYLLFISPTLFTLIRG
ncbi:MAG: YdcF family protein [Oscillospiraceae bacterium]|nr:YdcF family protein [Oscillospiraceae bacterium]